MISRANRKHLNLNSGRGPAIHRIRRKWAPEGVHNETKLCSQTIW